MLESHHCPFGTAEAPHGFNRARIQYRVTHKNTHSSFKAAFNGGYISSLYKKYALVFTVQSSDLLPPALFSSFWARMRLYTVSIRRENQEIVFAFLGEKKSKLGVNWTAWVGARDVMIRLLLASELLGPTLQPHWQDCTHTNWILQSSEVDATPDCLFWV